ncbi:expressed unknown protein [Seminavis robusta]|uniref:Helicase-associated domain-containing protein n=1 Tax=Seminavis robusta TaxID=568900 RepID=A0A9N8E677_9STRA|nr:expressed unknown protein [Seminavis robusta]|eukprot:Sro715_g191810.1 n/a (988) ;mRNA; f:41166-44323
MARKIDKTTNPENGASFHRHPIPTTSTIPQHNNYRRRRKPANGYLSSLRSTSLLQNYILLVSIAISWVGGAYSFITPPRAEVAFATTKAMILPHHNQPWNCHLRRPFTLWVRKEAEESATSETGSDEADWRSMLFAFKMYKAAYGHLKVPLRFVVPSLAPWPEKAWGMKLGQRVAAIRSTGKYVNDEKRRKILDDMGFVWRLRSSSSAKDKDVPGTSFQQIYEALVTYREHVQKGSEPINIPNNFVVPDCDPWPETVRGLPLGKKMSTLRSKSFLAANPGAKEKLKELGLQVSGKVAANDARFQLVYDALEAYKKIHGDLHVPQPFVVPEGSQEWPEDTWGLRLGARVNAIRSQGTFVNSNPDRKQLLDDLGFIWAPHNTDRGNRRGRRRKEDQEKLEAEKVVDAASTPKQSKADAVPADNSLQSLFGDSFDFDDNSAAAGGEGGNDTPQWGLEAGSFEDASRKAEEEAQAAEEYKPPKNLEESLKEAAERAVSVGIIREDEYIERRRVVKGKREKDIPWFNDDFGDEFVFDDVVEALTIYRSIYGDFSGLVNGSTFVIPTNSEEYSDDGSSMDALGYNDMNSRAASALAEARRRVVGEQASLYDELEELTEIGELDSNGVVAPEASAEDWPEHLGGMRLGSIVERIQDGSLEVKHLPERKKRLDKLKFDWGDPDKFIDIPFEKAMCAMFAYYLVRGDMFAPRDFVMPDEEPWPLALAGYKVGEAVHRIRELQYFFEAYHLEKVGLLRMIDFLWFPEMAEPLDPNQPEVTIEQIRLTSRGHPDMDLRPDEWPPGRREALDAAGPFSDTEEFYELWRRWHNWEYVKDIWYEKGRRDNAFYLRKKGYPQMAEEHEAKYGPGLFAQINATMHELDSGAMDRTDEERYELLENVQFYRHEMTNCTDIPFMELKEMLHKLDRHIVDLAEGLKKYIAAREEEEAEEEEEEEEYEYEEIDLLEELSLDAAEFEEEDEAAMDGEDDSGLVEVTKR